MHKNDLVKIRNEIGSLPVMADGFATGDNVAIALATYFEGLHECPSDDTDDEIGWSQWAVNKTNDVLERIIKKLSNQKIQADKCDCPKWDVEPHPDNLGICVACGKPCR